MCVSVRGQTLSSVIGHTLAWHSIVGRIPFGDHPLKLERYREDQHTKNEVPKIDSWLGISPEPRGRPEAAKTIVWKAKKANESARLLRRRLSRARSCELSGQ